MITQSVPLLLSVAHLPAVAAKIAVPAAPPARGTTLLLAESTAPANCVTMCSSLLVKEAADGSVYVDAAVVWIMV